MPVLTEAQDAYGAELLAFFHGEPVVEIIEREDSYIGVGLQNPAGYFAPYEAWSQTEKQAVGLARGRVLDLGCGAGRVGLHLQSLGLEVVGIDNSPGAVQVCRERGLKGTRLLSIEQVSLKLGLFDTLVMFGNNFGLMGSRTRARWLLKRFYRLTNPGAQLLAASNDIYQTGDQDHLAYQAYNRQRGRMSGQIRLRVRHKRIKSPWFDYLMVSPGEMEEILSGTGWSLRQLFFEPERSLYTTQLVKV